MIYLQLHIVRESVTLSGFRKSYGERHADMLCISPQDFYSVSSYMNSGQWKMKTARAKCMYPLDTDALLKILKTSYSEHKFLRRKLIIDDKALCRSMVLVGR